MKAPANPPVDGRFRFRLDLAYDGTDFYGFAKQSAYRTVAGELLSGLVKIFGEDDQDFRMRVAGRTDAGVHAQAQVLHLDLTSEQLKRIRRGHGVAERLNKIIAPDVRVISFEEAEPGFHARYSALSRRYRYSIADRSVVPNPMTSRYLLEILWHLEVEPMVEVAKEFIGLRDFRAFCKERDGTTTIRRLREISVKRRSNGVIDIEIEADAFCHNMVRSVVGALMSAGSGRTSVLEVRKALSGQRNENAYKVQAPQGLTLIKIAYPAKSKLAAQAELTQRTRTLDDN
ncbi:MAG: tRNA pseudouridine(38-40) synthase TruA [Rhodoluna sp.]|jgi:tRNA pseudouridine38-40 synthase|nr:tRNA pseudouridine(38-40) synthase TruA [Rhodoluna sp.]